MTIYKCDVKSCQIIKFDELEEKQREDIADLVEKSEKKDVVEKIIELYVYKKSRIVYVIYSDEKYFPWNFQNNEIDLDPVNIMRYICSYRKRISILLRFRFFRKVVFNTLELMISMINCKSPSCDDNYNAETFESPSNLKQQHDGEFYIIYDEINPDDLIKKLSEFKIQLNMINKAEFNIDLSLAVNVPTFDLDMNSKNIEIAKIILQICYESVLAGFFKLLVKVIEFILTLIVLGLIWYFGAAGFDSLSDLKYLFVI